MKSKKAWGYEYLEELSRNQAELMINGYSEEQMIKFLLTRGLSVDEIVGEAKRMRNIARNHQTYLAKINSGRKGKKKKHDAAD